MEHDSSKPKAEVHLCNKDAYTVIRDSSCSAPFLFISERTGI